MTLGKKQRPIIRILENLLNATNSEHEKERIIANLTIIAKITLDYSLENWEQFYRELSPKNILTTSKQNGENLQEGKKIYEELKIGVKLPTPNSTNFRYQINGAMHSEYCILRRIAENVK